MLCPFPFPILLVVIIIIIVIMVLVLQPATELPSEIPSDFLRTPAQNPHYLFPGLIILSVAMRIFYICMCICMYLVAIMRIGIRIIFIRGCRICGRHINKTHYGATNNQYQQNQHQQSTNVVGWCAEMRGCGFYTFLRLCQHFNDSNSNMARILPGCWLCPWYLAIVWLVVSMVLVAPVALAVLLLLHMLLSLLLAPPAARCNVFAVCDR